MFQFTGFPPAYVRKSGDSTATAGLLHSDICGSMPTCGSPQLFAADRVLHRLISPRHPPYALRILTFLREFISKVRLFLLFLKRVLLLCSFQGTNGGDEEIRTPDLLHAKQALSQLSYTPTPYRKTVIVSENPYGSLKTKQCMRPMCRPK